MTHKQWLLSNAKVHIKHKGDLTADEHDKLLAKIEKLIWTEPDDLLPGDQHLLEEDFGILGKASALDQRLWVAEMEASMTATKHERSNNNNTDSDTAHNLRNDNGTITTKTKTRPMNWAAKGSGARQRKRWQ